MLNPPCSLKLVLNIPKYVESSLPKTPRMLPQNLVSASSKWRSFPTKNLLNFLLKSPRMPHQNSTCVDLPSSKNGLFPDPLEFFFSLSSSPSPSENSTKTSSTSLHRASTWFQATTTRKNSRFRRLSGEVHSLFLPFSNAL